MTDRRQPGATPPPADTNRGWTMPTCEGEDGEPTTAPTLPQDDRQPDLLPRGATVGRYIVLDHLGAGAMGIVYAAYDPELDRKVALKLLRAGNQTGVLRQRLVREAQALARLAHPNVVAVHDVGAAGERVFVAMEFVEGVTLTAHLGDRSRRTPLPWRDALEIFTAVGRGLSAAHRAGLVHRDLKPDNIMIGRDGRVRVMDFGLARVGGDIVDAGDTLVAPREQALELALTRSGTLLGTPLYMAPEQWRGEPADARSDQFAFCVAFWEVLHGRRPFRGESTQALARAVLAGEIDDPTGSRGSLGGLLRRGPAGPPGWFRDVLRRGLDTTPARRYPDIETLLAALSRAQRRRRLGGAAVAGLGLTVGLLAAGASLLPDAGEALCTGLDARLVGVWDRERRAAGEASFLATGKSYAAPAWSEVAAGVDAWSADWVAHAREACLDTRVRGVQSEQLLDRRMGCLERRLDELDGLTELLARADDTVVTNATIAVQRLARPSVCSDTDGLLAAVLPPPPEQVERVAEVRARLDHIKPLIGAIVLKEAEARARPLVAEADELGYAPLRAEVRRTLGDALRYQSRFAESETLLFEALAAAEVAGDDLQLFETRRALLGCYISQGRLDEANLLHRLIEPELDHPGREGERADHEYQRSEILYQRGLLLATRAALERALALRERVHGPESLKVSQALDMLSYVELEQGEFADALAHATRAVAILERRLGPDHPQLLWALYARGSAQAAFARIDEARASYQRALDLSRATYGPDDPEVARGESNLGDLAVQQNDNAAAIPHYERALAIRERRNGSDHQDTAGVIVALARVRATTGRAAEAVELIDRAVATYLRHTGPDSSATLYARTIRGWILRELRQYDRAIAELTEVAAAIDRTQGETDALVDALLALGEATLEAGGPAAAVAPLTRALALSTRHRARPERHARIAMLLARALRDGGGDQVRARALATEASELWATLGPGFAGERDRTAAWLAAPGSTNQQP